MAPRGRPKKFNEPLVKRQWELPESLYNQISEAAKPSPKYLHGRDLVDVMREALTEYFQKPTGSLADALGLSVEEMGEVRRVARGMDYLSASAFLGDLVRRVLAMPEDAVDALMFGDIERAVEREIEAEEKPVRSKKAA